MGAAIPRQTAGRKVAVLGLGLRQVQDALNKKADEIQHEFVAISEQLDVLSRKILEVRGEDRAQLRAEQDGLRSKQAQLAQDVNEWRQRARAVTQQRGETGIRAYMEELKTIDDPVIAFTAQQALEMLDAPEEARARDPGRTGAVAADPGGPLAQASPLRVRPARLGSGAPTSGGG